MSVAIPESQALTQEATDLTTTANALVITDASSFERAAEALKTIKVYLKRVGEVFDPIVDSAHRAHKTAVEQRAKFRDHALKAEASIKLRMSEWEREQDRLRREAEEVQRRERERLEAEAAAKQQAELQRLQKDEEDRRLEAAAAAEARGDTEAAAKIIEEPVLVAAPPPVAVFVPPVAVQRAPTVAGVSFRDEWDFEIVNEALIPREYLMVDEVKLRRVVKALRGATRIPGVKAISKRVVSARG